MGEKENWKKRGEQTRVEKGMRKWSEKGDRKANRAKVKTGGYNNCITRHQRRLENCTMQYAGTALPSALVTVNCYK